VTILDTIEALREFAYDNRPRHWKVLQVKCSVAIQQLDELAKEVALMEAVCEAVTLTVTPNTGAIAVMVDPHAIDAVAALVAYRKEAGDE
jgi:hypothetical protein